jgi:primosomal replication protein N
VNQLVLTARIAEVSPLRYTPAGLPVLELRLEHESQQDEASTPRAVKTTVKSIAIGLMAERVGHQALDSCWTFKGFLATARNAKHPVFHLQDFQPNP